MRTLKCGKIPDVNSLLKLISTNSDNANASDMNNILSFDCGLISYMQAYEMQLKIFDLIKSRSLPGVILLLEHNPVITIGSNKNLKNLLITEKKLKLKNIELIQSDRGGDITLHSPGQIVCYTIINLPLLQKDLSFYVNNLEEVIIDVLKKFGIQAIRIKGYRGVFVNDYKIASIGLKVKKWITFHGFSLNVNNNLKYFDYIIACGLKDHPQTSMKKILKRPVNICNIKKEIIESFNSIFKTPVDKIVKLL
jgi:lipoyl(octanoyl) transferase